MTAISFIDDIPKTEQGQTNWIIRTANERLNRSVCIDLLREFKLCKTKAEMYKWVCEIVDDTLYHEGH